MHLLKLTSLAVSLLVLSSCGGGGGGGTSSQLPTTGAILAIVQVDNAASPVIAAVTDNTGKEKFALIGTKDSSGAPLSVTQALYISASGDASTLTIGLDGLPANLSDAAGNKITFANFTNNTMDITLFDPAGNQVTGPITVNVDPTVLAKLRAAVGTLASPSAQGAPLVSGLLGISSQDWISGAVNTMSTAYGVGGCASMILTFAGTGSFIPVGGTIVGAVVGAAGCGLTLIDFAQQVKGTNNPLVKYLSVAGDSASCVGGGELSECISLALPHIVTTAAPPPSVPTNLTVSSVQKSQVRFYWTGSTDDVAITGYRVYRDGSQIADVGGVLYTDLNVIPGTQYCYTVIAHDENGNSSGVSNQLCVTIPLATLFESSTTPVSGASGVSVSSAVFTTFNEAIDTSSLNTSTFTLTGPSGLVTGTVSYNAATNSAVFTPSANLAYAATYTANVTTGVKNLTGNPLASNYSWNFTTASNIGSGTTPLGFTDLNPTSVSTSTVGYQPTLTALGANFSNLTQIRFDWSGVTSGSMAWVKGTATWDPSKVKVYTDDLMTLKPVVTQMNDPAGLTTWTVTLAATAGATATKTFTVNYTPSTTPPTTCAAPQTLVNGQCITPTLNCTLPQVLQNGACVTPSPICTSPQVLTNGVCVTPSAACTVAFNTSSESIDASGGQRQVILTTSNSSCTWSATSNQSWVHSITPLSGMAGATLTYTVDPNSSTQSRSATITAGQTTLTVSQLGTTASCTFSLGLTTQSVPANGGTFLEGLLASNQTCARTALSNAAFITNVSPASGNGDANISYTVAQNTSASPRSGTLTIAGQTLTVNQDGLTPVTPAISYLSFTSATADSANRTLTIYGSYFAAGDVVQYRWLNPTGSSSTSASVSSSSQLSAVFNPGAVNDTIYVKVCQSSSSSSCSGELAITVTAPAPATPPGNFTVSGSAYCDTTGSTSSGAVQLTWGASTTATSYDIIRDGSVIYTGVTQLSFLNNGINLAGQTHSYIIRAHNSTATTTDSNSISVSVPSNVCASSSPPALPTSLSPGSTSSPGPSLGSSAVTVSWNAVSGATLYVGGINDVATGSSVLTINTSGTSASATLSPGKQYRWFVEACNSSGCSSSSALYYFQTPTAAPTIPAIPTSISPGSTSSPGPTLGSSAVTVSWNAVSGATLYVGGINDVATGSSVLTINTGGTSASATLSNGKQYRWFVEACNSSGCSSSSALYYFQTPATQSGTLPAGYVSQGGLTWMPISFYSNWASANIYCAGTINGQTGWRIPTQPELSALYASGAMNGQGWTLLITWSSTANGSGYHYNVGLDSGSIVSYDNTYNSYVSCVR